MCVCELSIPDITTRHKHEIQQSMFVATRIVDISNSIVDINNVHYWYQQFTLLISIMWIVDINNCIIDIKNVHIIDINNSNCWYQQLGINDGYACNIPVAKPAVRDVFGQNGAVRYWKFGRVSASRVSSLSCQLTGKNMLPGLLVSVSIAIPILYRRYFFSIAIGIADTFLRE